MTSKPLEDTDIASDQDLDGFASLSLAFEKKEWEHGASIFRVLTLRSARSILRRCDWTSPLVAAYGYSNAVQLIQDRTYTDMYEGRLNCFEADKPLTFLFGCLKNAARKLVNDELNPVQRRAIRMKQPVPCQVPLSESYLHVAAFGSTEELMVLYDLISRGTKTEDERVVMFLLYAYSMVDAEIAEATTISIKTVQRIIDRCKRRIQRQLRLHLKIVRANSG